MNHLNPHKTGLVFSTMIGGLHLVWSVLVFLGLAQPLFNFIFWAHMIQTGLVVGSFDLTAAVTLVIITSIIGYAVGYVVGVLWNKVHKG